jgi:redox-sensitive bicupin YhaK (pirin superfamily)
MRSVKAVYRAGYTDYSGLDTYAAMPGPHLPIETFEPFIFLNHHGHQVFKPHNQGLPFGPHPHKGFETVTFIIEGDLIHKDSTGYTSQINAGGIQWMTAGKGIIHSEQSSQEFKDKGGPIELLQLWVNLPARLKDSPPGYIGLQKPDVPELSLDGGKVTVNLVSGSWGDTKAPIQSLSDVHTAVIQLKTGGNLDIDIPKERTILFYVIKGNVNVNGSDAEIHETVQFDHDDSKITITALEDSLILFGHALPNNEPIAAHGPFVMNTQEEIRQAFVDYQQGKLGTWH